MADGPEPLPSSGAIDCDKISTNMGDGAGAPFDLQGTMDTWWNNADVYYGQVPDAPDIGLHDFYSGNYSSDCFVAGTKVLMADESEKNIEDVEVGDFVIAYNPYREIFESKEVLLTLETLHSGENDDLTIVITWEDGTINHCTDSNPMWIPGKDWCSYNPTKTREDYLVQANQLTVGDPCVKRDNSTTKIASIEVVRTPIQTYSLRVKQWATFIANGIVVHNKCFGKDTMITGNYGLKIPIQDITTGGEVLTGDGKLEKVIVFETVQHKIMGQIGFTDGTKLDVSIDHPIKVDDHGWSSIEPQFNRGDIPYTKRLFVGQVCSGKLINSIKINKVPPVPTYNISKLSNGATTYYANDILVRIDID